MRALWLFLCFMACAVAGADRVRVTCLRVVDGDTLVVQEAAETPLRVRLWGIDAPERSQPFGKEAKAALAERANGRELEIERVAVDRYGRAVCRLYSDVEYLNAALVREGFAWHSAKYAPRAEDLAAAETAAKAACAGLWQQGQAVAPWTHRSAAKRR
jgi:endonuclease YncB( thermonuclease family)